MTASLLPLLLVVLVVCLLTGLSQLRSAWKKGARDHLAIGLICFSVCVYAISAIQFERAILNGNADVWSSSARVSLWIGHVWNIAFVSCTALLSGVRWSRLFVAVQFIICLTLVFRDGYVADPWVLVGLSEQSGSLAQGLDEGMARGAPSDWWALLEYVPWLISIVSLLFVFRGRQHIGESFSSLLGITVASCLFALAILQLTPAYPLPAFLVTSIFVLLAFSLLMAWRITDETELMGREARRNERRMQLMAKSIGDVFYMADIAGDGGFYISPAFESLTGRKIEELSSNPSAWHEAIFPADRERVVTAHEKVGEGVPLREKYRILRPDGSVRWVSARADLVVDPVDGSHCIAGVSRDCTEETRTADLLVRAEHRTRTILEQMSDAVFVTDDQGRFTFICPNAHFIFGYDVREVSELGNIGALLGEDLFTEQELEEVTELCDIERRVTDKHGRKHDLLINVRRVEIEGGTRLYVCRDITKRKKAEKELAKSRKKLEAQFVELEQIYRTSPVGLCLLDRELRVVRINEEMAAIFRLPVAEILGQLLHEIAPPIAKLFEPICQRVLSSGIPVRNVNLEKRGPTPAEKPRQFLTSYFPVAMPDGAPRGVNCLVQDITQIRRAEQEAEISEERLHAILDTAVDAIITIDFEGNIESVNPSAGRMFGYTESELVGRNVDTLMPSPDRERHDQQFARYLATGISKIIGNDTPREVIGMRKDSSTFPAELTVSEVTNLGLFTGVLRDVSKRKAAEAALLEAIDFNDRLIDTAQTAILVLDGNGRVESFNRYLETLTGKKSNDARGANFCELFVPERKRKLGRYGCAALLREGFSDGTVIPVIASDGQERDVEWYNTPLSNHEGETVGMLCIGQDVTERQELQREIVEIANREQRLIGQELHDSTQQQLIGLGLIAKSLDSNLNRIENAIHEFNSLDHPTTERAEAIDECLQGMHIKAAQMHQGLQQAAQEVQQLSRGLVSVELDSRGLMSALCNLARKVNEAGQVRCEFNCVCGSECTGGDAAVSRTVATQLFRIAQEAVSNAVKHSHADFITIDLQEDENETTLRIVDDGIGLPKNLGKAGMGLRIMAHRAELVGASLHIGGADDGGTEVTCSVQPTQPSLRS